MAFGCSSRFGAIQMFGTTAATEKQKEWVKMAMASSKMISSVLDEVLSLSKIEEGNLTFHKSWFNIAAAIEEVRFMFIEEATRNDISLDYTLTGSMDGVALAFTDEERSRLMIHADPDRLKEVLVNFCSNAIKFTASGGSVKMNATIRLRKNPTGVLSSPNAADTVRSDVVAEMDISVADTGTGIAPADFDKLFVAYSQIHPAVRSTGRGQSSTGLGLCITKHIVDAHGGRVYVRSDGPGKGSTFGFHLEVPSTAVTPDAQGLMVPAAGACPTAHFFRCCVFRRR